MTFRTKYRARSGTCNQGHKHPSGGEARLCDTLHIRMRSVENSKASDDERIVEIQTQHTVKFQCGGTHRIDFVLRYANGRQEYIEFKGFPTDKWQLQRKMYNCPLEGDMKLTVYAEKREGFIEV